METINDRIGTIIEALDTTKTAFAESLNVTQQYISKLTKTGVPSIRLIEDICKKHGINEIWLRTGEGNMFSKISPDDRYSLSLAKLTMTENIFIQNTINMLAETEPEKLKILEEMMKKCLGIE